MKIKRYKREKPRRCNNTWNEETKTDAKSKGKGPVHPALCNKGKKKKGVVVE